MAQGSFSAQVGAWAAKAKQRTEGVYRESAQRIVAIMQTRQSDGGNMRIDTGFLRASLVALTSDALPSQTFKPDGIDHFAYDAGPINLTILGAKITEPITVVYTANYARPREYGARGQAPDRFVGLAAQQWQRVVSEVAAEAQARTEG
jgi:hypothetical protein